ncbi:DNA internalization-related competence protein ComEC/Rec2 [Lactobacillus delbrueckii]|uniref:DNA internalization-related competence protein ComEC/Rec2 n=1 Tax=Lactobacillus delbrueckii TaxID=1584 RepID=UPI0009B6DF9F|nr:DNA internalization-related competence protein ComEC/Rec2 [Lactobacillus delbrueckii]RXS44828.1 DNA internalization-related competence protein ComEC/Rec2 [Lactobacillus delbrueckii subsp. bulgaricus]
MQAGFYFLLALASVSLCGIFQSQKWGKLFALAALLYLLFLLKDKYGGLFKLALAFLLLLTLVLAKDQVKPGEPAGDIRLYPDQVKITDGWLSGRGQTATQKVQVYGPASREALALLENGQSIDLTEVGGAVSEIEPATNPGQFDYRRYLASQHVYRQVKLAHYQVKLAPASLLTRLHGLRWKIQAYLKRLPRLLAFFASELLLAENPAGDNQANLNTYRDLGVIHILSISGMHVGIYVFALAVFGSYLHMTKEEVFAASCALLTFEVFLSAGQPGFIRATLSYVFSAGLAFKSRRIGRADLLGLTYCCQQLFTPRLLLETGGILTYVLALGLVLTAKLPDCKQAFWLNGLLTPFLLYFFYQVNVCTIFYNILVVPYFNYIVMPMTGLALLAPPSLAAFFEKILEAAEGMLANVAKTGFGQLIYGQVKAWQLALLFALTFLYLITRKKKYRHILAAVYLLIFVSIHFPLEGQVSFIDVGQGDSILLTTPIRRQVYLIDTGGKLTFGKKKQSQPQIDRITIPLLKAQGISQIDGVFVSHQDADHVGDLGPLLEEMPVKRLYMGAGLIQNPSFRARIAGRVEKTKLVELKAGMEVKEAINFQVLHPEVAGKGENKDSLSLTCRLAGKSWAFTGDLDQAGEEAIIKKFPDLKIDYFKLGHHGSDTSSSTVFLRAIQPKLVFISAGRNNRYHHPKPETLAKLHQLGIPYLNTQTEGMISWHYGIREYFSSFLEGRRVCYHY